MRAPSIIAQCLPGLLPQDRSNHSVASISDADLGVPSPAVEIVPSKTTHPYKYAGESVDIQGLSTCKGRVSVADIIGFSTAEPISTRFDGFVKSWDGSIDLVNVLKREIRDGQLCFRGKRILELSCGHGLAGIFACLKGASVAHFQDLNAETIRITTIPNVIANLEQARDRQSRQPESPVTPTRFTLSPDLHFYAGDWDELPMVLSVVKEASDLPSGASLSFSEEDFLDGCSSQDGSSLVQENFTSRRSRKLSGSRAWERASQSDASEGGYDIILMTEVPHSMGSMRKVYSLIKKCLRPPYGVMFMAAKKNYVNHHGGPRQLRSMVEEEGLFGAHLITEMSDREIWKFFLK